MNLKQALYAHCLSYVQQRIARTQEEINKVQASANEESKSSAGDKHETGRAMAQLEVEKNAKQLAEAEKLLNILHNISPERVSERVIPGSLVHTSNGVFFIAVSIGAFLYKKVQYFGIAGDSPLGKMFLHKGKGEVVVFNGKEYVISAIE